MCVLIVPGAAAPHGSIPPSAGPSADVRPASGCPGPTLPTIVHGTVGVEGTLTPRPSVGSVNVTFAYYYATNQSTKNGSTLTCFSSLARTTTNASGGFVLNLTLPATTCGRTGCLSYDGPFAPYHFRVGGPAAPAYFLVSRLTGPTATLEWVSALEAASTRPSLFGTVSVFAPTTITGVGLDGAGLPSQANLTFAWKLAGTAWVSRGPSNGSTFEVEGNVSGSTGTLTLWVNGSYNHTAISLAPVSLYLTAVATRATGGAFVPTALDVGVAATVSVNATGAGGYSYTATLDPGGTATRQSTACSSVPAAGGAATLTCTFTVSYATPGSVQPSATVTNGYSPATWNFPTVAVASGFAVVVGPDPDRAYAGTPVRVAVAVEGGTGTAPFGPACLLTGDGRFVCDKAPGPNWTIAVSYPNLGTYHATATVADAAGTNRTIPIDIEVVAHPQIPSVVLNRTSVPRGQPVSASATVTGGALPLSYWWNASGPESTLAFGQIATDGVPAVTFVTGTAETNVVVTLTVVDALGTHVAYGATLTVSRPSVGLAVLAPQANGTTLAGSPLRLSVVAVDALGALVPGYSGETYLRVSPDCGPGWVNDSSGPVEGTNGTFAFPAVNWSRTALNLTVTATVSGACDVSAWSTEFPARVGDRFDVAADAAHLHLARPEVVRGGPSENATLYTVLDRFGNPDLSGYLIVVSRFGSLIEQVDSEIHGANGSAKVWVNYTAQGSGGGTLTVLNESGVAIFGPLTIPPLSLPPTLPSLVWGLLGVAAIAAAVAGIVVLRRRSRGGALATRPEDPEDPLRRLAEGRSHVLSRLSADQDADLDEIAAGCPGRPPDAAEIAEWVGTLVTEGVVRASVGLDGRPRFRLAGTEERSSGPRVEIDPMALDAALARRDHDSAEEPPG